jgi:S-adenosylmethionine:tRNA-ribosyltransferase-isomerase (queuine synthetase)
MPTLRPEAMEEYLKAYAAFELMLDNTKCPLTYSEATGIDLDLAMKLAAHGKEFTWQKLLKPGEILVFNNTRMLHGRRKFEMPRWLENRMEQQRKDDAAASQEAMMERHLVGGYTNIDDSLNRYRTLLKEANIHRIIPNVGNGTVSVLP